MEDRQLTHTTLPSLPQEELSIIQLVDQILYDAIRKHASDIHFEPYDNAYRIRIRLDGILTEIPTPPESLHRRISSRLKVMAGLDISERRLPQDGRFTLHLSTDQTLDCRVSTCPTSAGEKVVVRVLNPQGSALSIHELGLSALQTEQVLHAIERPHGLILITGPTGSGKTMTLYALLNHLNTQQYNISSIEDPIEIKISGINQVNINPKAGLHFSTALRAFLRQDPDIMMVGEIRDLETAEIAINASQTGHLILSTLHTNSAAEALVRLRQLGIPSYHIADSLALVVAQRLVRRVCPHCKLIQRNLHPNYLIKRGFTEEEAQRIPIYQALARGCQACHQGYRGRVGLFETMPISLNMGDLIQSQATPRAIFQQALKDGMMSLYQSGLEQVKAGITTLEEIARITVHHG